MKNEEELKQLLSELNEAYETNPSLVNKLIQKKEIL